MDIDREILEIVDNIDFHEDEFKDIEVSLNDIEKMKLKKSLQDKILKHKKVKRRVLVSSFLVLVIILGMSFTAPVFAKNGNLLEKIYKTLGFYNDYKDYSDYIGVSKEQNGYKVTIESLVGTEKEVLFSVRVDSKKPFPKTKESMVMLDAAIEGVQADSGSTLQIPEGDYAMTLVSRQETMKSFPKRGKVCVNVFTTNSVQDSNDKLDIKFEFKVDFSKAFKNSKHIAISKKINMGGSEAYLKELYISPLGLKTITSGMKETDSFLLQLDNNIYEFDSGGGGKDGELEFSCHYITDSDFNKAKTIKLIPIKTKIDVFNYDERSKLDKLNWEEKEKSKVFKKEGNIKYPSKYTDYDGESVEIYKVERDKGILKVYQRSDKDALLRIRGLALGEDNSNSQDRGFIYKDNSDKNGWVREFRINDTENEIQVLPYANNPAYYEMQSAIEIYNR